MKFTKKLVLALIALPLTLGATNALAAGGARDKCGRGMNREMMQKLNLTETQKKQLKEMRSEKKMNKSEHKASRKAHESKLMSILTSEQKAKFAEFQQKCK